MAAAGAIRAARAFVEFFADLTKFDAGVRSLTTKIKKVSDDVGAIGRSMAMTFAPLAAGVGFAARGFASFDDVMRAVAAVSGGTTRELAALTDQALYLGRTTSFTAQQTAEAMLNLARAGFTPGQIQDMIGPMLNLSRATGADLATASDIAAVAIRAFNLSAADTTRVADVLTATANNSAQTIQDLGEALKYVAPAAADAGMTLEDTAMTIGVMANYGIRGSMAGTAMRQALIRLANRDTQKMLMEVFGVSVLDAEGNMRRLHEVLKDLDKAMSHLTAGERVAVMQEIFDLRGMSVGLKVASADLSQLEGALKNAQGTAARVAEEMDAGLGGAQRQLASAAEGLGHAISASLNESLIGFLDSLTAVLTVLTEFIQKHATLTQVIAIVIGSFTVLSGVLISVSAVTKGVSTIIMVAAAAYKALAAVLGVAKVAMVAFNIATWANPILLVVGLIALLIAGIAGLVYWLTRSKKGVTDLGKAAADAQSQQKALLKQQEEAMKKAEEAAKKAAVGGGDEEKKWKSQQQLDFEKEMARRVRDAKIAMIEDALEREIAAINARYDEELEKAKELGASVASVEKARQAEIAAARERAERERREQEAREQKRKEEERAQYEKRLDEELAEARIEAEMEGVEAELAKLELERQKALEEARSVGADTAKVEELYDLRRREIERRREPDFRSVARFSAGFSGFAVLAQGGGPVADTARNTAKMTRQLGQLNQLLDRNLRFN